MNLLLKNNEEGYGSGGGCGCSYGSSGYGYGSGSGCGDVIATIAGFDAVSTQNFSVLRIGCEAHTIRHWREHAENIAKQHEVDITYELREQFNELLKACESK